MMIYLRRRNGDRKGCQRLGVAWCGGGVCLTLNRDAGRVEPRLPSTGYDLNNSVDRSTPLVALE